MVRGKTGALFRALLVAASVSALSIGVAHAQQAGDLDALGQRILENPQDVSLNLQYAAAAEAANKPRLALVAYERILINDPTNEEARRGYERVRRTIEPGYTITRVEVGARYDTNAVNMNEDWWGDIPDSTTYYGRLMIADEREIGDRRWRSILNLTLEENDKLEDLNYGYLGVQTGPIFYMAPHVAAIPALGVGVSMLADEQYFSEVYASLTIEGRATGISYWARARGGYREFADNNNNWWAGPVSENGTFFELQGGLTKPNMLHERDTVTAQPFIRWSAIDGDMFNFSPGRYTEYGVDLNYNYQLTDHVQLSGGAFLRMREFDGFDRRDAYFAPQASVTLQRLLPCDCDIRLQYRERDNNSTDDYRYTYDAQQVTLGLTSRF